MLTVRYTKVLEVHTTTIAEQMNSINISLADVGDGQCAPLEYPSSTP